MTANFRRAGLTVLLGSALGYGVSLLLTPIISRLFSPDVFGSFATVAAVVSVFVGVSTFRLEVLAQRVTSDEVASLLLRLALLAAGTWSVVILFVTVVAAAVFDASLWWLATGPLVLAGSVQLIGSSALVRSRRYRALAVANLVQGAGTAALQVLLGVVSASVASLFAGFALGRLVWVRALDRERHSFAELGRAWRREKGFAVASGTSAAINSLAGQAPILICAWLYGQADVGFLAMAVRVLVAPLSVVGQAAAAANLGEIGQLVREGRSASRPVRRAMVDLLLLGLVPCGTAAGLGLVGVPFFLGDAWATSGVLVALLSVGTLAQFVVAPFSQLLNICGHVRWLLTWDVCRLLVIVSCFVVPVFAGGTLLWAVGAYSAVLVLLYFALARLALRAVKT